MDYIDYFSKFNNNDKELYKNYVCNENATSFLLENAPRLYCPEPVIEETFAFRLWTMRKHIVKTDAGFLITEFLPPVYWAGKYNTINAPLIHHLNEFRWLKNSDWFLDYIKFFIDGEGSAYSYHVPALAEMFEYCKVTANEDFLQENVKNFENYFNGWVKEHLTENGLFWSIDDREGTEYTISGTTPDMKFGKGLRPFINGCMYGDALAMSEISSDSSYYLDFADNLKKQMDKKMWDGEFYKSIHPIDGNVSKQLDYHDIPKECNARELTGYVPWMYNMPDDDKCFVFEYLKDVNVFKSKTGFSSADRSNTRFMYHVHKPCCWNGKVWPFSTSLVLNATINLLNNYRQKIIDNNDLYDFVKTYANMHYIVENGKKINYIGEVMLPDEYVWDAHEWLKNRDYPIHCGGPERGRDYNHSTYIDIVLRGLCGVDTERKILSVHPKVIGIWKWFKIENLTYRKRTYNVYYDEDGTVYGKGKGVIIENVV